MKAAFTIFLLIQGIHFIMSIDTDELEFYYKEYIYDMGYNFEEHEVITEDGYKLTLWHIIPSGSTAIKKVIYFQPGFLCTSWVFFQNGKNSLPFMLSDLGYDVWVGNSRGTIFSGEHISKDPGDWNGDYWDYSMDDNVIYDLPATIDYIKETSGAKKIDYIGHSMGTTIFYMLYMHNPSYVESSINKYISLGTVPNIAYTTLIPIQILDKVYGLLEMTRPITKAISLGPEQRNALSNICKTHPNICKNAFETFSSTHPTNRINYETLYPFLYYYPGGTSSNTLLHWSQIHQEKKLVYFNPDYDKNKEVKEYDTKVLKKWKINSFIQRSDCDTFSTFEDVTELYDAIENKDLILLVDTPSYGHTDDLAAESSIEDIYLPIISFLKK